MARRDRRHRLKGSNTLILTSLMDILTVLVLFLLKSFVIEGEVITPVPGVSLPESSSMTAPQASVVIAIFNDSVMMNGEVVATISDAVKSPDLVIDELARRLDSAREQSEEIARLRGSTEVFSGKVSIQGDREIDFAILQRVMYTCSVSGYEQISLAVLASS